MKRWSLPAACLLTLAALTGAPLKDATAKPVKTTSADVHPVELIEPAGCPRFAGRLVKALSLRYRVEWRLIATTGATTASTLERLDMVGTSRFDVAVTSLGVNDVVAGRGLGTWRRQQRRRR